MLLALNKYIDHTLLKTDAKQADFEKLIDEAIKYDFASVCVSPYMAIPIKATVCVSPYMAAPIEVPRLRVCTVVGFPHGNIPAELKYQEVEYFTGRGIDEVDFVINYGELLNGQVDVVKAELGTIGAICSRRNVISKAIVETCYLNQEQKELVFRLVKNSPVDFIKTSTGFGTGGAVIEDIALWKDMRGSSLRPLIKAAGGIKDLKTALAMIRAGADRLGMSSSVQVMEEHCEKQSQTSIEREAAPL
jgi:deoxyribose-phosphate aldolase